MELDTWRDFLSVSRKFHIASPYASAGIGKRCGRDPQALPYNAHRARPHEKHYQCEPHARLLQVKHLRHFGNCPQSG
eukprot:3207980-Amphidinium_carterae.1